MSNGSNQSNRNSDPLYWLIAFGLICTGIAAPIGFLMIVMRFLDGKKKRGRHPYYSQQAGQPPLGARTTREPAPAPGRPSADLISELDRKGKRWAVAGGALAALFTIATFSSQELFNLIPLLCCIGGGLGGLWAGLRKRRKARRYRNYLAMIGRQSIVSISALASATGLPPVRVREDLADMLDDGLFPQGFLDYGGDRLVLPGDGVTDPPVREQKAPPSADREDENSILKEIRSVNDAIQNEKLSAQIDRVGVITAKILDYQKSHPDKAPQLHSFLSYYLPTTLKILRAYGQLESQEISGENISAAMRRIEGMMDKVVEGFEKQLDLLFQGDAMDIATDVEVLERMLAKDGLSDHQGLTLRL